MAPNLKEEFSPKRCHEAHQVDQRDVLNVKMYVVGAKNQFSYETSNSP